MKDYYDIKSWTDKPEKIFEYISNRDKSKLEIKWQRPLVIDVVKLYALLKAKVSPHPNGFYTFVQQGLPLDNMIWWDFVIESDKGFIHIWRTTSILEAMYYFDDGEFDLNKFFHLNIKKYIKDIQKKIELFDKHTVYINHYRSYKDCVEYLWKEIVSTDLTPPVSPVSHAVDESIYNSYKDNIQGFLDNSIKFHSLGKSLVLNAAFQIESFLNLIIRVGASHELKKYPGVLKKHLNSSFIDKLKNLKFYSVILNNDIDLEHKVIKDANELMTLRNKYVHFDESSVYNKIGEVFFDDDYPLYPTSKDAPAVDSFKQIFHRPDPKTVKKSFETANGFVDYLQSLFLPEYKESVKYLIGQNPIGYNETKKMYSAIYNQLIIDFYTPIPKDKKLKKEKKNGT